MFIMRKLGSTSNIIRVTLRSSTTGDGLTGLAYNTSGLIISTICDNEATATAYSVGAGNVENVTTLGTFAAPTSGKCRFREVDATNHKGLYEIQIADARFAVSGARVLRICISGAAGLMTRDVTVQLTAVDPDNAVRFGLTALPNANAGSNQGLPLGDASGQVTVGGYASGQAPLQPSTAGRTLLVDGSGLVDVADKSGFSLATPPPTAEEIKTLLEASGSSIDTLMNRLTGTRAALLDKLNITGNVAAQGDVLNVGNNTRVRSTIPLVLERPDSGSETVPLTIELYDESGNMEAPDSTPTVALTAQDGTDLSARVSSLSNPSTGRFTFTYTNANAHSIEVLRWTVTVVEGGATRTYSYLTQLVDTSAVDFTSADRQTLSDLINYVDSLEARITSTRAALLDNLANLSEAPATPADVAAELATYDGPTRTEATADKQAILDAVDGISVTIPQGQIDEIVAAVEAAIGNLELSGLTSEQATQLLAIHTATQRLRDVEPPEAPVEIIPTPDNPAMVYVVCRANRAGVKFTLAIEGRGRFVEGQFISQPGRVFEGTTDTSHSCRILVYPSSALTASGFSPATYAVHADRKALGSIEVPDEGGDLAALLEG
jgi:hypothetical protein